MFSGWTENEVRAYEDAKCLAADVSSLLHQGMTYNEAAMALGINQATLRYRMKAWDKFVESGDPRLAINGKSTGRPRSVNLKSSEFKALQLLFLKTNRNRDGGSRTLAARMFAQSSDCSPETSAGILKPRKSKHTLPVAVCEACTIPPVVVSHYRHPKETLLNGPYVPGTLRMAHCDSAAGLRRLRAGERQSWDDGTINFGVCVPHPWGGDRCADRFKVHVGRFQLLLCVDDAWDYCPGFTYVIRDRGQYRAEDCIGAMYRVWSKTIMPESVMIEGGNWQSDRAFEFYRLAGVKTCDAKGRPHMKLVENYFNRLWSVLSPMEGQVGRFRGEMEQENKLMQAAREGRTDPRPYFPMLDVAMNAIEAGIGYLNNNPVQSKHYGTWIPAERYKAGLAENPRPRMGGELEYLLAPERHVVTVRNQMVACTAPTPFGEKYQYHFADDSLYALNRARVRIHFDPYTPRHAALVLAEDFTDMKAGTILTRHAACLDSAPEIIQEMDRYAITFDDSAIDRALKHRDSMHATVRREHRAIDPDGRRIAQRTEIRAPDRTSSTEIGVESEVSGQRSAVCRLSSVVRRPLPVRRNRILTTMELIEGKV
jgi:hypothetical protein